MSNGVDVDPDAVGDAADNVSAVGLFAGESGSDGMRISSDDAGARHDSLNGLKLADALDALDDAWADKCRSFSSDMANYAWNLRGYASSVEDEDYKHSAELGGAEVGTDADRAEADWYDDLPSYDDVHGVS
ncbi:MAG: hypothetical protein ACRDXX_03455 [Stackebrandtia sp.]